MATDGRYGCLSDRVAEDFFDAETGEKIQMTSGENFEILTPSALVHTASPDLSTLLPVTAHGLHKFTKFVKKITKKKKHPCGSDVISELEHRSLCRRNETRTLNLEEQYEKSARAQSKRTEIRLATRLVAWEGQQAWKRFIFIVH